MVETATANGPQTGQAGAAEPDAGAVPEEAFERDANDRTRGSPDCPPARGLGFLSGIELEAAVELGRTTMSIGQVLGLGPGSVVQLDKMLGDPVELMIKERLIARGEVVVVDERFGLRITEIVPGE